MVSSDKKRRIDELEPVTFHNAHARSWRSDRLSREPGQSGHFQVTYISNYSGDGNRTRPTSMIHVTAPRTYRLSRTSRRHNVQQRDTSSFPRLPRGRSTRRHAPQHVDCMTSRQDARTRPYYTSTPGRQSMSLLPRKCMLWFRAVKL